LQYGFFINVRGHGQLHQDAAHRRISIQLPDQGFDFGLRSIRR